MSTTTDCLIQQAHCGRVAGTAICPKCGADEQLRYTTQEAVMLAKAQATAMYWQNEASDVGRRSADAQAQRQEVERLRNEESKRQGEEKKQKAPTLTEFQDHPADPQMVAVPSGSFLMGSEPTTWLKKTVGLSETPQHRVTIAYKLAMGRYPVTFEEWDAFVADGGTQYQPKDEGWGRGKRPVINVSWDDAQAYIVWLNNKMGIQAKDPHRYRLPSEAEWEYACRAGSQTKWCFGDKEHQLIEYAWFGQWFSGKTQTVGQKKPNAFGLYDMHGNVWEHVQDCGHSNYKGAPDDGTAWEKDHKTRVLRGGSWLNVAGGTRSATRSGSSPDYRSSGIGFRLARRLP